MSKKFRTRGLVVKNNEIVMDELVLTYPGEHQAGGIGEFVKDGDMIAEIVPDSVAYAVEMYVRPLDLPLLAPGQKVRFLFNGFPAIVFSGWPKASSGTFGGKILAVESNVSVNGSFRVLVVEDGEDKPWPRELKMGTGAIGIALLKDVPVWYELWRNINGFPPDYYQIKQPAQTEKKRTSPVPCFEIRARPAAAVPGSFVVAPMLR